MCGRISITQVGTNLSRRFKVEVPPELKPNYNGAPTQSLPVILDETSDRISLCRWGLIPSWAKDMKIGYKLINARAETVAIKPSFRSSFAHKRCLVVVDGFYEWKRAGTVKIPYRITLKDGEPFAMAGLWAEWKQEGQEVRSFTIITTSANKQMASLHDRMPVILPAKEERKWLTGAPADAGAMMIPFEGKLEMYRVSEKVNSVRNNTKELINEI